MTEEMLNKFFANRMVTKVQDIVIKEGAERALFRSVELEKIGSEGKEGMENYNYSCVFTVDKKEYSTSGQISLVDENGVMKVSNLYVAELKEQEE